MEECRLFPSCGRQRWTARGSPELCVTARRAGWRPATTAPPLPLPPPVPRHRDSHHSSSTLRPKWQQDLRQAAVSLLAASALLTAPAALASDTGKVGACLLSNCQAALAGCLEDAQCLENLVCLQLCEGAPDVTACQVRSYCGAGPLAGATAGSSPAKRQQRWCWARQQGHAAGCMAWCAYH